MEIFVSLNNGNNSLKIDRMMPEQNGTHFADKIFFNILFNKKVKFLLKFHWILFLRI